MKRVNLLAALVFGVIGFLSLAAVPDASAKPFAEARIIFEVNVTDGDAGIQVFLDAEPWNIVQIFNPNKQQIAQYQGTGSMADFGWTELFSESNEPPFEDVPLQEVLDLFPEGKYEFKGTTVSGANLRSTVTLSHTLPCGPEIISPPILPVNAATIQWNAVVNELDHDTGECGVSTGVVIAGYQVIVDTFQIILPADATAVTIPHEFLEPGAVYEFEVLAIEANGNQTITGGSFTTQ